MSVAIVTGASQGFGRALAEELAHDGWDLVVDARHQDALEVAAAALPAPRREGRGRRRRCGRPGPPRALVAAATGLGGLDLLVNNASTLGPTPMPALADYPLEELEAVYRTNVVAPLALVQQALPALLTAHGAVVNVTSDAAVEGYEGWGGYGSSKAALEQVSNVLAAEQPALRVYRFDPGDMRTQMHQDAFPGEDISDRPEPESVVPALLRLLADAPPSGRYQAGVLLEAQP